jgi:hypothetical protein
MSIAQFESEISQLSPNELRRLREVIDSALGMECRKATPEMLQRRREITQKFLSGEWSVDLPPWEETRASEKQKDPWND